MNFRPQQLRERMRRCDGKSRMLLSFVRFACSVVAILDGYVGDECIGMGDEMELEVEVE